MAKNHTPVCRERFLKIHEEQHPEELLKITEKFFRDREGEEETARAAPEVIHEKDAPEHDDKGARHEEARSSEGNGISADLDMGNVVYSISADEKLKDKAEIWENEYIRRKENKWKGDVTKTKQELAMEGFENRIMEVHSLNRVIGMGELMGLIPTMS